MEVKFMEVFLLVISMIILSAISAKALYNMPNPGKRFYDGINKNKTNNKKNS